MDVESINFLQILQTCAIFYHKPEYNIKLYIGKSQKKKSLRKLSTFLVDDW